MQSSDIICNVIPDTELSIEKGNVFNYPTHTHSHYEMTLYQSFQGGINVNGEFFDVSVPSAFLFSPSDFHRISVDESHTSSQYIKIGFYEKIFNRFKYTLPDQPIIIRNTNEHPILVGLFNEIHDNQNDQNYVSVLIEAAMFYFIKHGNTLKPVALGKKHSLVINTLRYINKNFKKDISLTDIAEHFSVSPQYLSSVFTSEVGVGFSAYISDLRLKTATEFLLQNNLNITEICYESGYRNLSHFLRSFKQKYGVTPKEYRKDNT